jgi:hypothetical protein
VKRVYVCSPYRGDTQANVARAVALCREIALAGDAPLAVHAFLPEALDDADPEERALGQAVGLAWLAVADEVLVAGPLSEGMRREIEAATQMGIPVRFVEGAW